MIEKIFFLCLSARASHLRCKASHFIYYGMPSIKWKARINGMVSSEKWRRKGENKRHEECTWMSMAWSTLNNFSFYLNFIHSIHSLRFFQLYFKHNTNEHEVAHSIQFTHFNSNAFTADFFLSSDKWWKKSFFLSIMPSLLNAHASRYHSFAAISYLLHILRFKVHMRIWEALFIFLFFANVNTYFVKYAHS